MMCPHDAYLDAEDCTRCMDPEQILDNRHFLLTESPQAEERRRHRLSTLLGVPEGEQGVRLPPT